MSMSTNETDYISHDDAKRVNNPTMEQRGFMVKEEAAPYEVLYPRDPSLDPQLVWKGKDAQDRADLAVPAVPIYIQEKIMPSVLVDDLRRNASPNAPHCPEGHEGSFEQLDLFADTFNGLEVEEGQDKMELETEFFQHTKNWSNRMILGDSLLVMNSLAEKEGLKGKVQCIYIDPPYGIKFGSNWQVSTRKRDVKDGKAEDAAREPEVVRAFRDTWQLGIHSYLAYLRDRLVVARELLTETGSCFVQIGDENVHLVRCLMDEVFGADNVIAQISVKKTAGLGTDGLATVCDYLIWYGKDASITKVRGLFTAKEFEGDAAYVRVQLPDGSSRRLNENEDLAGLLATTGGRLYRQQILLAAGRTESCIYRISFGGETFMPTAGRSWATNESGMMRLFAANRVEKAGKSLAYVRLAHDFPVNPISNLWSDTASGSGMDKVYVVQTSAKVIERCLLLATDPGDLVLDPTCGSGTTAYVAEQWGRRWITCDTSRVALALARTRLMSAKFPSYLLADSPEGVKKETELSGRTPPKTEFRRNITEGFVYKRVPHVTLKSIANNPEIDGIAARYQPKIDEALAEINRTHAPSNAPALKEWEVPRLSEDEQAAVDERIRTGQIGSYSLERLVAIAEFWDQKRAMQREIDAAIAKHADVETLYDQPYEDKKKVRVAGPFTVESLSPHRVLATDEELPTSQSEAQRDDAANDFVTMVIENLRKAGVQNTKKGERLKLDDLAPYAGKWIHATATFQPEGAATALRIAVSVGPEYGAVSPMQIKEAAKEAIKGIGYDILVVCGYAFDPHVSEEAKDYGSLTVLPTRMNADLLMADDLLKKTGAGNLFMVFGEPDISVDYPGHEVVVTLGGLDVFDPTTGEIRSSSVDDIACWFIDTNYNGESFFVRHAYFTGGNEPYEKLKKALKAEIDEGAWSALYSNVSRPFAKPETGKFAVKVINHYGDEVLKVYEVKR